MDNTKYSLTRGPGLSLSVEDMDKLIMNADGSCALLYLYIIRTAGLSRRRRREKAENDRMGAHPGGKQASRDGAMFHPANG
jgi:hypothetical protein